MALMSSKDPQSPRLRGDERGGDDSVGGGDNSVDPHLNGVCKPVLPQSDNPVVTPSLLRGGLRIAAVGQTEREAIRRERGGRLG